MPGSDPNLNGCSRRDLNEGNDMLQELPSMLGAIPLHLLWQSSGLFPIVLINSKYIWQGENAAMEGDETWTCLRQVLLKVLIARMGCGLLSPCWLWDLTPLLSPSSRSPFPSQLWFQTPPVHAAPFHSKQDFYLALDNPPLASLAMCPQSAIFDDGFLLDTNLGWLFHPKLCSPLSYFLKCPGLCPQPCC